ncbi:MAG: hypothetical protein GW858_09215 [Sphingomonadales bacterium]|nr:hypothetical protein [Sphingomonadales bacterium]NCQ20080.1 hypothetical protein [Sphingomonadales bacterium]NCT02491.1 hypothetical protein [Sphingomonadales bacterium]
MTSDHATPATTAGHGPGFWAGLYCASIAIIATLRITDAIPTPVGLTLFVGAMALLIPLVRAAERRSAAKGCMNAVIVRYNRRMLTASMGYVLGLGIAIALWNAYDLSGPVVFAIALLPTLPTFGMIWAMGRYLVEETDEYLRYRTMLAAIISLGMVLATGIFWGFLEMFELVPHIWAWWVLPVWSGGLGVAQLWMKVRGE